MSVLIVKLGAAGDVVRTTPLLRRLNGPVSWITVGNIVSPVLERFSISGATIEARPLQSALRK